METFILILMQSRSGSSLLASIFDAHGYDTKHNNHPNQFGYMPYEHVHVKHWLFTRKRSLDYHAGQFCLALRGVEKVIQPGDCVKIGVEYWPCFRHLKPKVFIVRRDPEQIAKSLSEKRGKRSRKLQGPRDMWSIVRRRNKMLNRARDESGGVDVDVDQIMSGDFSGIRAAFDHHGLEFDEDKAKACIDPKKWHRR